MCGGGRAFVAHFLGERVADGVNADGQRLLLVDSPQRDEKIITGRGRIWRGRRAKNNQLAAGLIEESAFGVGDGIQRR
ncbi:MAG: hypothetical protein Fur0035_22550 [Anaerolineales bacterium]